MQTHDDTSVSAPVPEISASYFRRLPLASSKDLTTVLSYQDLLEQNGFAEYLQHFNELGSDKCSNVERGAILCNLGMLLLAQSLNVVIPSLDTIRQQQSILEFWFPRWTGAESILIANQGNAPQNQELYDAAICFLHFAADHCQAGFACRILSDHYLSQGNANKALEYTQRQQQHALSLETYFSSIGGVQLKRSESLKNAARRHSQQSDTAQTAIRNATRTTEQQSQLSQQQKIQAQALHQSASDKITRGSTPKQNNFLLCRFLLDRSNRSLPKASNSAASQLLALRRTTQPMSSSYRGTLLARLWLLNHLSEHTHAQIQRQQTADGDTANLIDDRISLLLAELVAQILSGHFLILNAGDSLRTWPTLIDILERAIKEDCPLLSNAPRGRPRLRSRSSSVMERFSSFRKRGSSISAPAAPESSSASVQVNSANSFYQVILEAYRQQHQALVTATADDSVSIPHQDLMNIIGDRFDDSGEFTDQLFFNVLNKPQQDYLLLIACMGKILQPPTPSGDTDTDAAVHEQMHRIFLKVRARLQKSTAPQASELLLFVTTLHAVFGNAGAMQYISNQFPESTALRDACTAYADRDSARLPATDQYCAWLTALTGEPALSQQYFVLSALIYCPQIANARFPENFEKEEFTSTMRLVTQATSELQAEEARQAREATRRLDQEAARKTLSAAAQSERGATNPLATGHAYHSNPHAHCHSTASGSTAQKAARRGEEADEWSDDDDAGDAYAALRRAAGVFGMGRGTG